ATRGRRWGGVRRNCAVDIISTGLSLCRDNNHKLPLDRRDHDQAKTYGAPRKEIAARQSYLLNSYLKRDSFLIMVLVHLRTTVCARPPNRLRALSSAAGNGLK